MQASSPRTHARSRRLIGIGAAALLAVPASLIMAAPAQAAEYHSETFASSEASTWIVPAGVREVLVTAVGGSGGNAAGQHGGLGGNGAYVSSLLPVETGDELTVWAGAKGGDAGTTSSSAGVGGDGYLTGGNGATSGGSLSRPGAGGGGASAVEVNGDPAVIAGGGGGGGGRGVDNVGQIDACRGGAGGDAGEAGGNSWSTNNVTCPTTVGGAAGTDALADGSNATAVPTTWPINFNGAVGGSGGGGAGAGGISTVNTGGLRTAGGGGGGGGASLADEVQVSTEAGDGFVLLEWEVAYETALSIDTIAPTSVIGETVDFLVWVQNTETNDTPVGNVTFDFGDGDVETVAVQEDEAGLAWAGVSRASSALGTFGVSASYEPLLDSPFAPSENAAEYVVEKGDSLTVLELEPADPVYFDLMRATATVSVVDPAVTTLDGVVTFFHGDEYLGTVAVDPATGEAVIEFTETHVGFETITAYYTDDTFLNPSDDVWEYDAAPAATTTTLKASASEIAAGGKVKFDATVTSSVVAPVVDGDMMLMAADVPVAPAGTVRFLAGDKVLGEVALSAAGTASLEVSDLAVGTHEVVAHFVSSVPELASSKSAAVKVTVVASKAGLASTGVDGGLLGGAGVLAALMLALGAGFVIRRRQSA